jgi:hypothetical protein
VYKVFYGPVPFKNKMFKSWKDANAFIKKQLDTDGIVRSVSKEHIDVENRRDDRDSFIQSVDIIEDR